MSSNEKIPLTSSSEYRSLEENEEKLENNKILKENVLDKKSGR